MPKRADQRRDRQSGLAREQFDSFLRIVKSLRQEVDDANMEHAQGWKQADPLGVHPQAAKLILRLDRMDEAKRTDMLRAFDLYRSWMSGWTAQGDLVEQAEAIAEADDESPFELDAVAEADDESPFELDAVADEDEEPGLPLAAVAETEPPEAPIEQTAPADWTEPAPIADDDTLDVGGFTFAAGKQAGREGMTAEQNPHLPRLGAHAIWEQGRLKGWAESGRASPGDREAADENEGADGDAPVAGDPLAPDGMDDIEREILAEDAARERARERLAENRLVAAAVPRRAQLH